MLMAMTSLKILIEQLLLIIDNLLLTFIESFDLLSRFSGASLAGLMYRRIVDIIF